MAGSTSPKFPCPSCGKQYTWKPALAGKSAKCACGALVAVPATAPEAVIEDIYDVAFEAAPAVKPSITKTAVAAAPPASAPAVPAAAYIPTRSRRSEEVEST